MLIEEELQAALARLGSSPEEIAESLNTKGISGYRRKPTNCPIANYLKQEFPNVGLIYVGGVVCFDETKKIPTPTEVREFINGFDKGFYPKLTAS